MGVMKCLALSILARCYAETAYALWKIADWYERRAQNRNTNPKNYTQYMLQSQRFTLWANYLIDKSQQLILQAEAELHD